MARKSLTVRASGLPGGIIRGPVLMMLMIFFITACEPPVVRVPHRPITPWAFRSVLDKRPRMLTLALDSSMYVAYDLQRCRLYKAWKGGVLMEGTAYTDRKNVQPTSWGTAYVSDSAQHFQWVAVSGGRRISSRMEYRSYVLRQNRITLKFRMTLPAGDTIAIEESPEFITGEDGAPGLERTFTLGKVPQGVSVALQSADTILWLRREGTVRWPAYFRALPSQKPPLLQAQFDHRGRHFIEKSDCLTCHETDRQTVGPAFGQIALRYPKEKTAIDYLVRKVRDGGSGVWGQTAMNPHPQLRDNEIREMINYIFTLKPQDATQAIGVASRTTVTEPVKPGFGAPLDAVHPSYDLRTIHGRDFNPRVGGLAFLPDGRLLVATWDTMGGVYILSGVETGDTSRITVKQIALGLAEPLGIEVADGGIYVLQKHELTRLVDLDGDEVTDEYVSVCNSWGVTDDFHEFAFGLVYQDGFFYATLSMAMRLIGDQKQHPDRGRTIRISKDGTYEWVNYGLRTPNGIGKGVDGELFVTDNQGEWMPANKLIHVVAGEFHGMPWGLPDTLRVPPTVTPPAIWLPEDEIGNSPSEPILLHSGPYKGQMLHGDVTHGGIKRDFLEKINGSYQGAVFRFTQGLEAGVNRLRVGPDSAIYIGGVGMVGGWSWRENKSGLQKMTYNGKTTFEMLAIRCKPRGFEIEFTTPLAENTNPAKGLLVQQWWYKPTEAYGGPKMDLATLRVNRVEMSPDRRRMYLDIPGLLEGRVVYFRLPETLRSATGSALWSSEAWYTLNHIPEDGADAEE